LTIEIRKVFPFWEFLSEINLVDALAFTRLDTGIRLVKVAAGENEYENFFDRNRADDFREQPSGTNV
jgi:hypothetical protein